MTPKENLNKFGYELPNVSTPGGSYISVNVRDNIAYVTIQFPILNEEYLFQGRLGEDLSTEEGYKAMEICALNVFPKGHKNQPFRPGRLYRKTDSFRRIHTQETCYSLLTFFVGFFVMAFYLASYFGELTRI